MTTVTTYRCDLCGTMIDPLQRIHVALICEGPSSNVVMRDQDFCCPEHAVRRIATKFGLTYCEP